MHWRRSLLWFFAVWAGLRAEIAVPEGLPVEELVRRGLAAEAACRPDEALPWFRAAVAARPADAFLLHKVSKQLSDRTEQTSDPVAQQALVRESLHVAEEAARLAPKDPVCVLSLAVCYGKLSLDADNRTKVDYAYRVRQFAEEALALDASYSWAHHVLGRWHLEVMELGATKRFFAGMLYRKLPRASLAEGLWHLERAVELGPDCVAHRVELGFALRAHGREAEARAQWQRALELPVREIHDEQSRRRASAALATTRR